MTSERTDCITSTSNRRVVAARKLTQRKHRREQGRFLVEGLQLLHMALEGGARPLEVFYCAPLCVSPTAPALLERFRQAGAALISVSEEVLRTLSPREGPQGIVAVFALGETPLQDLHIPPGSLVVVLDRPNDPGNVGTLIRAADAVGAAAVILLEPAVDPFEPRAVRSSMGSLFNLPVTHCPSVAALCAWLRNHGLRAVAADAHRGVLWGEELLKGGVALILGNEAQGLSPDLAEEISDWVRLPMVGKADSLNVAVAGGVLMYAWLRANWRD